MADKFINETGVATIRDWIKGKFATEEDLNTLSGRVDDIVAEGGEPNKIDSISVNGAAVAPDTSKNVDLTVPTKMTDLTNDGDGDSPFTTTEEMEEYVAAEGGKINTISVNGTAQPITAKNVDITVPTVVSALLNDSGFQTQSEVQALIDSELEGITGIDFQVVDSLPATGEHGVIYLVHKGGESSDIYDEFIWVTPAGGTAHFEQIGNTQVDLSGYWAIEDLTAMTVAEVNAILNA